MDETIRREDHERLKEVVDNTATFMQKTEGFMQKTEANYLNICQKLDELKELNRTRAQESAECRVTMNTKIETKVSMRVFMWITGIQISIVIMILTAGVTHLIQSGSDHAKFTTEVSRLKSDTKSIHDTMNDHEKVLSYKTPAESIKKFN